MGNSANSTVSVKETTIEAKDKIVNKDANPPITLKRFLFLMWTMFVFMGLMTFFIFSVALLFINQFSTTGKTFLAIGGLLSFAATFPLFIFMKKNLTK